MSRPLDIKVARIFRVADSRFLKAHVDITINDALLLKGLKVLEGRKGGLFLSMPNEQSGADKRWYDTIRCLNTEIFEQIQTVVLEAYRAE